MELRSIFITFANDRVTNDYSLILQNFTLMVVLIGKKVTRYLKIISGP
jgi:hypothetical protein